MTSSRIALALVATAACLLLAAPPADAKKTPASAGKAAGALSCPAANKVNSQAEDTVGCPATLARDISPIWEPATKAEFIQQSGGRPFAEEKAAGTGGIRCAKFFKKKKGKTATIHRIYGGGAGQWGGYWTFDKYPAGASYRSKFAVCHSWNDLAQSVECRLGANTEVVIAVGPGQSVGQRQERGKDGKLACTNVCADVNEHYPASKDLQVVLFGANKFCNK